MPWSNADLVAFAKGMVGMPYWYGTCVYRCTEGLLSSKARQYPNHYGASRMAKYRAAIAAKKICTDCVGLVKGFFWTNGGEGVLEAIGNSKSFSNKYGSNSCPDKSANDMRTWCISQGCKSGTIGNIPDVPGILVYMSGHVGVYVGNGEVVEARGFAYGVVKTKLRDRPWKNWTYLPSFLLTYTGEPSKPVATEPEKLGSRYLRKGCVGEDVKALQTLLNSLGYECGEADGDFGTKTDAAVRAFQKANGLEVDGVVGEKTLNALTNTHVTERQFVVIEGGNCWIREQPNPDAHKLGLAKEGERLPWLGQVGANGWLAISYKGQMAWVSGLYGKLV